jgi:hypothetical protein
VRPNQAPIVPSESEEIVMKHSLYPAVAAAAIISAMTSVPLQAATAQGANARNFQAPAVFQAAGPSIASIQATVDAYRLALGDTNNGNNPGPLPNGRREINWDGGGSTATSLTGTPFAGFLNTRGASFTTPGSGFVQAPTSGLAETFANPTYETIFAPFSPVRLFSPIDSNRTVVDFFVPGSDGTLSATTHGFGAIFSDVDLPDGSGPGGKRGNRKSSTLVEYYGRGGELLYTSFVAASPGDGGFAFLGITFEDARIARVRITSGNAVPGADDDRHHDVVVMDDFLYGEPQLVQ